MKELPPPKFEPIDWLFHPQYWGGISLGTETPKLAEADSTVKGMNSMAKVLEEYLKQALKNGFTPLHSFGAGTTFPLHLQDPETIVLIGSEKLTNSPELEKIFEEEKGNVQISEGRPIPPNEVNPFDRRVLRFRNGQTYERRIRWGVVSPGKRSRGRIIHSTSTNSVFLSINAADGNLDSLRLGPLTPAGPDSIEIKVGSVRGTIGKLSGSASLERIYRVNVYHMGQPVSERAPRGSRILRPTT